MSGTLVEELPDIIITHIEKPVDLTDTDEVADGKQTTTMNSRTSANLLIMSDKQNIVNYFEKLTLSIFSIGVTCITLKYCK